MDAEELISRAWSAVEKSGVPEALQAQAFTEALSFLKEGTKATKHSNAGSKAGEGKEKSSPDDEGDGTRGKGDEQSGLTGVERLAQESGVAASDLTDILTISGDKVLVTPPTRRLGKNVAEQARTVITLVSAARAMALDEDPVSADAVRTELERKRCYQANNFAAKHLAPLNGLNAGANRNQIVLTSKWVAEFVAAVNAVHGRTGDEQ